MKAAACSASTTAINGWRSATQSHATELHIDDVSRIHWTGGSLLRTSRTNPAKDDESLSNCVSVLRVLGITHLICIGGDDTTFGAAKIAQAAGGDIHVATVPKTIDNDLAVAR